MEFTNSSRGLARALDSSHCRDWEKRAPVKSRNITAMIGSVLMRRVLPRDDSARSVGTPVGQGAVKCDLVGLLDTSPSWESLCNSGDMDACRGKQGCKIMRGRLTLDIGSERQDDLGGTLLTDTLHQLGDPQVFRADSLKWREPSSKRVIAPPENSCPLQWKNIGGGLHNAEFASGSLRITAQGAFLTFGKESAEPAGLEFFPRPADGTRQLIGFGIGGAKHPERYALRTAWPYPGKAPQLLYQITEGFGIIEGHGKIKK